MMRCFSRNWVFVCTCVAFLAPATVPKPALAVAVPEGNCCCPDEGGNICIVTNLFDCEFRKCVFLGADPCPKHSFEFCPARPTGNCCCSTDDGNFCDEFSSAFCELIECVFLGDRACPPPDQPCEPEVPGIVTVSAWVKPGSCPPTPLNRNGQGVLPVAVLGTNAFDVSEIVSGSERLQRLSNAAPAAPLRHVCADVAGPDDLAACAVQADSDATPDGRPDLNLYFSRPDVVSALDLAFLPQGAQMPVVLSGDLHNGTTFIGLSVITLLGKPCDAQACERFEDGRCVPCPEETVCVINNNSDGGVFTTSSGDFETTAGDLETGPQCRTPCTSDLDCFATSKCERCDEDGFCRSRCPGKCSDRTQPCSECDGAGICRDCCDAGRRCPELDCRSCCQAGQVCRDGECRRSCTGDENCDAFECEKCDDGVCVSKCTPPQFCFFHRCTKVCNTDADCPTGQFCGFEGICFDRD